MLALLPPIFLVAAIIVGSTIGRVTAIRVRPSIRALPLLRTSDIG